MDQIGMRIYQLRRAKDWSMSDLAARLGTGSSTIYRWEHGATDSLKTSSVEKLARVFGVTVEYLMGYVDDPYEKLQPSTYSEEEMELLSIFKKLSLKHRHALLAYAWDLEKAEK